MPRILVAEDDPDISGLVRHYLERDGFTVDVADSGREVVPRLRETPADLVVLDAGFRVRQTWVAGRCVWNNEGGPAVSLAEVRS